jgi:DNA-binding beta-propeller fold protein YncE
MRLGYASALISALVAGCTASDSEVRPPSDQLYFPTGIAVSPDEGRMFVTNANSELQYDSGSVAVFDLSIVDQVASDWTASGAMPENCARDTDHTETLICDETQFMQVAAGSRIGNFATAIAVQDTGNGTLRLIIPTRGDPSVTWVDFDGTALNCNADNQGFELCDDEHRLSYIHNDPNVGYLPEEPFDAYVDSATGYVLVTHLTTGAVTLINSPPGGIATISDVVIGVFAADATTGLEGSTGVSARIIPGEAPIFYVGSRSEDRIQMFTVGQPVNGADPYLVQGNYFFLDSVGDNAGLSDDTRSIAFSADGSDMYLINREPPTVQIFDTSAKPSGLPANTGVGASDICRNASKIQALDSGDGEKLYISCFDDGQLYVVDPRGESYVENILSVGRGPYAVAVSKIHKKVYVTNFLEDTIAVIDVAPGSPTRDQVVLRVGEIKPP